MRHIAVVAALVASATPSFAADAPSPSVLSRIPGADGGWDLASVNAATHTLYVGRTDGVMAVNLDTNAVTAKVVPGDRVHGVVAVGNTGLEASSNGNTNTVTVFDPATGSIKAQIATGQNPDTLVFDATTNLLVSLNGHSNDATLIDAKTLKAVGTIQLGGKPEFGESNGNGQILDNFEDKGEVAVIDLKTKSVTKRFPLSGCEEPSGLAFDKKDNLVISACDNKVAKVIDADTGKEKASIAIGDGPDAALFDEARHAFYVPCGKSGTLSVISVQGPDDIKLVGTVPTQPGARTGAVDEKTGRLYLPTAKFQPPSAPGKRPAPVPGTFEILVVGTK